jgi:hypothetical protein
MRASWLRAAPALSKAQLAAINRRRAFAGLGSGSDWVCGAACVGVRRHGIGEADHRCPSGQHAALARVDEQRRPAIAADADDEAGAGVRDDAGRHEGYVAGAGRQRDDE